MFQVISIIFVCGHVASHPKYISAIYCKYLILPQTFERNVLHNWRVRFVIRTVRLR